MNVCDVNKLLLLWTDCAFVRRKDSVAENVVSEVKEKKFRSYFLSVGRKKDDVGAPEGDADVPVAVPVVRHEFAVFGLESKFHGSAEAGTST